MTAHTPRWHRDTYAEAVWASELPPLQRLVALAYADHARDGDTSWVTYRRMRERTGLSRDAIARHNAGLIAAGWLQVVTPARQHRAAIYRLTIPEQSVSRTAEQSVSRTADVPSSTPPRSSSTPDDTSSPSRVPNLSTNPSTNHPPRGGRDFPEHAYEPNARAALATLRTEAHLTTSADELLCLAYEAGNGDPWQGYQAVKAVALDGLNGARDHGKVLRHRLGLLQAVR